MSQYSMRHPEQFEDGNDSFDDLRSAADLERKRRRENPPRDNEKKESDDDDGSEDPQVQQ